MQFDGTIDIATGASANSKSWKNHKWAWSFFVKKLKSAVVTKERFTDYKKMSKSDKGEAKDVGGYTTGYLRNGRRKPENVVHKQILTLDIDYARMDFWELFTLQYSNAAFLHSTHSHEDSSPRFRLLIPLSREVSADEYVAIARRVAGDIDIELFDQTTFETNRLMFWPSVSNDVEYYYRVQDGEWLDADSVLASYPDWTDSTLWPFSERQKGRVNREAKKQENPENKKGIIGAFCRAYSISEAIEKYLKDVYLPAEGDRYTYVYGSTSSGLIVYDDIFAYSHHGTDPTSGHLCNSFDLVRIHLYGPMDEDSKAKGTQLPSYKAMQDEIIKDSKVKRLLAEENIAEARYDFADEYEPEEDDMEWAEDLEVDFRGNYISNSNNLNLILQNDIRLKGAFKENAFDSRRYIFKSVPWRVIKEPEIVKNVDYSGIRNYLDSIYSIVGNVKIEDAVSLEFQRNSFNPIKDYLNALTWDGSHRVDSFLIDYFGADDCLYTREAMRKMVVGAVARIMRPGIKFDLVLTLVGAQGTGKSTLAKKLGGDWFSDTFMTVQGKDSFEQLQGAWIIEMAELSGLRKAEVEHVKHFITKSEDSFRPAYGRVVENFKRQCVFIATTNKKNFLTDATGNRRFMPIDVVPERVTKSIFEIEQSEIDQVWAEAVELYRDGESLFMSDEADKEAKLSQNHHSEVDERAGLIEMYLDTKLPEDWDDRELQDRRSYLADTVMMSGEVERDYVCIAEIWCECLGFEKNQMDRYKTRGLSDIIQSFPNWEAGKGNKRFKIYGQQRYFVRSIM